MLDGNILGLIYLLVGILGISLLCGLITIIFFIIYKIRNYRRNRSDTETILIDQVP